MLSIARHELIQLPLEHGQFCDSVLPALVLVPTELIFLVGASVMRRTGRTPAILQTGTARRRRAHRHHQGKSKPKRTWPLRLRSAAISAASRKAFNRDWFGRLRKLVAAGKCAYSRVALLS